jgi:hypothetical protein
VTSIDGPPRASLVVRGMLRLYPHHWRARYGDELAGIFASVPFSLSLVVDLIAGAIDARLHPELVAHSAATPASQQGEAHMVGKLMKLRCAGYGVQVTRRDAWLSAGVMIGGTVVFTLIWMSLHIKGGDNPYVDSFATVPFLAAYILSLPFTYLKGRRPSTQAAFILGSLALIVCGALAVGYITSLM